MSTLYYLEKLLSFDTTSANANSEMIKWVETELLSFGASVKIIPNVDESKANLFATLGPQDIGGVMLSGHTDVVPVTGQAWTVPAFSMTQRDGKIFGRGTADMKGFIAAMMNAAKLASTQTLKTPLHLALSYDEEIGCIGVRSMIDMLSNAPIRPQMCIVGEPTGLAVATGHKGKIAARAKCTGRAGHSALAPFAVNALYLANEFITELRKVQDVLRLGVVQDLDYDVPYTTLHVGRIAGGGALNIVPHSCELDFEIRNLAQDNPAEILEKLRQAADLIALSARNVASEANIEIEVFNTYPGLDTPSSAPVVGFVKSLMGANGTIKVAYGTEGGLFDQSLGVPTVVCGPGDMAQGHKPDEFITEAQLAACDTMLVNLLHRLVAGI
ncbi:MAG: acetylornithine deacetylase [Planktomarina sp.]|nr:acetylornithine deacetylase [Planktomarina sp.]MDT2032760.1 acetylornithine deacetylase [Planktomarina sp.]MDT2039077.1 acetylornithine deacetylase [Planktomarina sp.]MDT2049107.1 acetylornithine deacetylase [Planktomarina sp.]|tara:strand:- start:8670 stop:9824 length:1155 start_codon:yes stop_codon:yes gene_type:complete